MARNNRDPSIDTIASQCIAVRLRMVNRVVTNIYDEALRPLGIKVSQMNVLVAAAKMKLARPAEICEALQLDGSTLSRNLERMKARGWLEVVPDPDGRAQPFRVTKLGRKVLEELLPAWELAQKKAGAVLGQDLTEALARAASRLNKPSRGSDRDLAKDSNQPL